MPRNPNNPRIKSDYTAYKKKAISLLREGYSINDIQRATAVPQYVLAQWRDEAGIKPLKSGFNSNRNRLPYLEPIVM